MVMVVVMMPMAHRAIVMTPAAEAAVRAGEQTSDKGQYKNEDDETEHCYSPFADRFARPAPVMYGLRPIDPEQELRPAL